MGESSGGAEMKLATFWRVIWPERGPMFVIVGGIVSLLSDFSAFLGNLADPNLLVWPLVALAGLLAWFCFGRVGAAAKETPATDEQAVKCRECDAFRVMLFASAGVALLLMAGQGETATERFGRQLGVIEDTVTDIAEDTTAIRDVTSSAELVRNPRSAGDLFRNAWIYSYVRRDADQAWASLQELYRRHTPNKLDAADLYFNTGRVHLTRDALLAQMVDVGRDRRDAAMLVLAGRNMERNEDAFALYEEARAIDPDLPFAYWDVGRAQLMQITGGANARENAASAHAVVAGHERFIEVAGRKPVASYFYLPQHQADYDALARSQLESFRTNAATWDRIVTQQDEMEARRRR